MAQTKTDATVVPLFGLGRAQTDDETEYRQRAAPLSAKARAAEPVTAGVDLTGKPKAWLLIGRGGSGKTVLARWLGWRMAELGRAAMIAALDPTNRSLATWFAGVEQPELSDPSYTARWLRSALSHLMQTKFSGIFDFGGGDVSLRTVIDMAPTLAEDMIGAGVEPIACYCIGPSQDDLTSLGSLEEGGFRPRSTVLVLNEGKAELDAVAGGGVCARPPSFRFPRRRGPGCHPDLDAAARTGRDGSDRGQARHLRPGP